jgi:plasmid stabilization system protein ParE
VKKYEVIVTPEAEAGIVSAVAFIRQHSPENAIKWVRGLYKKIQTLETMPERCPLARENEYFEEELRQLVFKSHRIIFRIEKREHLVIVLHVRHGKQRTIEGLNIQTSDQ